MKDRNDVVSWLEANPGHPARDKVKDELVAIDLLLASKHNHYDFQSTKKSFESLDPMDQAFWKMVMHQVDLLAAMEGVSLVKPYVFDETLFGFIQTARRQRIKATLRESPEAGPRLFSQGFDAESYQCLHDADIDRTIQLSLEYIRDIIPLNDPLLQMSTPCTHRE